MRLRAKRPRKLGRIGDAYPARRDVASIPVQPEVELRVCWKQLEIGHGPAASLFVLGDEVLRFDCFGAGRGHYHAELVQPERATGRIYFPERSVEEQIERSLFELTRNLAYYLQRNPRRDVRRFCVDPAALEQACAEARRRMLAYLETVDALRDLRSTPA